ncbi:MAG: hypothetical protein R3202_05735 [Candidatus Competibacterales bacterium]|nr:hypothetical protein [Candidatus Competibacterales bacterium]
MGRGTRLRRARNGLYRVLGLLSMLLGTLLVAAYLWEAVILRWGEPDQSLLYWYLPLLLFGLILVLKVGLPLLWAAHWSGRGSGGASPKS